MGTFCPHWGQRVFVWFYNPLEKRVTGVTRETHLQFHDIEEYFLVTLIFMLVLHCVTLQHDPLPVILPRGVYDEPPPV